MKPYRLLLITAMLLLAGLTQTAQAQIAITDFVIQATVTAPLNQFTIPTTGAGYNYDVDINNDGVWDFFGRTGNHTITYGAAGSYTIRIRGAAGGGATGFPRIFFNGGTESPKITRVLQWGNIAWTSFSGAFAGCSNLDVTATDVPVLTGVTSLNTMFNGCTSLVGTAAFNTWNTATVTDMSSLFNGATVFNRDISAWNVSAVQNFNSMFYRATAYTNAGISLQTWNPVAATNMSSMFTASQYNMPLAGNWCGTTLQGVTTMSAMFGSNTVSVPGNTVFNQDISCWDVSTVQDFSTMFHGATAYNNAGAPLSVWNTGAATTMGSMFSGATTFNQNLSAWNVSNVTNFGAMFGGASAYTNLGVSLQSWNPVAATNMGSMFAGSKYNMPLCGNWGGTTLQGVTTMNNMFAANTVFNQDISCWNVSTVQDFNSMFYRATAYTNAGISLQTWNPVAATNMAFMFTASQYNMPLAGNWCGTTLQGVTTMSAMFGSNPSSAVPGNTVFNQDISCWDVSTVQDFSAMFQGATAYNNAGAPLSVWNTGAATTMGSMFSGATTFNQNLSAWNVSNVTNFGAMFAGASAYTNLGVSLQIWNPVAATNMGNMFAGSKYNMPLAGNWCGITLQGVITMGSMFASNTVFNQDISCWNVSTVQDFNSMFYRATAYTNAGISLQTWNPLAAINMSFMFTASQYNMPLAGNWCGTTLQGVTTMAGMFGSNPSSGHPGNTVFNQDISCWDVSTVLDFSAMFRGATAFNNGGVPLLPGWNTAAAINMSSMFESATSFKQPLAGLNITNVTTLASFLFGSGYPQNLYDDVLNAWAIAPKQNNVPLGAAPSTFCAGFPGRNTLIGTFGWIITDGGRGCTPGGVVSPAMNFWLMAGVQGGTNGVGISQALDFSGNSNHFNQATGSRQPLYNSANAINFNPVWNFDGADDYLATATKLSSGTNIAYNVAAGSRTASSSLGAYTPVNSTMSSASAWEPATATVGEYLTLDLGTAQPVAGIRTAGINFITGLSHWTTSFTVSYSTDNVTYTPVGGTYSGNTNNLSVFDNDFPSLIVARYIRIFPQTWNVYPALRADVYYKTTPEGLFTVSRQAVRNDNVLINLGYFDPANQYTLRGADAGGNIRFRGLVAGAPSFDLATASPTAVGVPIIISANQSLATNSSALYVNGRNSASGPGAAVPQDIATLGGLSSGQTFNGQIAEAIGYATDFSLPQKLRVLSYLAIKYGLTKSNDLDGDGTPDEAVAAGITEGDYDASDGILVVWNYTAAYHNNIIGIGRDANEGLHQQISRSSTAGDIIILSTDNNFVNLNGSHTAITGVDEAYVIIGHDNAATATIQSSNMPAAACGYRTARQWRVQRTNYSQGTNLRVDASSFSSMFTGAPLSDILMLIDEDGDGNFATGTQREVAAASYAAGIITFEGFTFDNNSSGVDVFTIGRRETPVVALVNNGETVTTIPSCGKISGPTVGYTYYRDPASDTRALLSYNANGNVFTPTTVVVSNVGTYTATFPGGTFTNAGAVPYYQMTNGVNSTTRLSRRLHTIVAPGTFSANGGVRVRVYYNPTENTQMTTDPFPGIGTIQSFGWFKINQNSASATVAALTPSALTGAVDITPVASGTEDGVAWVEFLTPTFSTFGYYVINASLSCVAPILTITGVESCGAGVYSIRFTTNGTTVTASAGTVVGNTVINIPLGADVTVTSDNGSVNCQAQMTFTGPASCPGDCVFPLLSVGNAVCNGVNATTYRVSFTVDPSAAAVTITGGVNNGNGTATGTIGTNMVITATAGNCVSRVTVVSPANCSDLCNNPLISIGGTVCATATTYRVNFTTIPGATVMSSAGTVGANSVTGIPTGTNVTLTVSFTGCGNQVITVAAPTDCNACVSPLLTITGVESCGAGVYSIRFTTNGTTVTASAGTVVGNTVINIPLGTNVTVTANNGSLNCQAQMTFTGPASCPVDCTFPRLSVGNAICNGVNATTYRVSFTVDPSATAVTITGGVNNGNGTATGTIGTNMVITATAGSCISRVTVVSPANCSDPCSKPFISISGTVCATGTTYTVNFTTIPGATVMSSAGTVGANSVTGIPTGTNVTLTVSFAGCGNQVITVASPGAAPQASFNTLPGNTSIACSAAPPTGTPLAYSNGQTGGCQISGSVTGIITGGPFPACSGGTYTETWTFTDVYQRIITHSRTITVQPAAQAAFVSLPGNMTIACGTPTGSSLAFTNNASGTCQISGSVNSTITGNTSACGGTLTERWTFIDNCGRTTTHSRTLTVTPAPAATFVNPAGNTTVSCSTVAPAPTTLSYSNGQSGICAINGSVTSTVVLNTQACPSVYVETWTFTDLCGRTITHSRNVIMTVQWSNTNIGNANGSGNYSCSQSNTGAFGPFTTTSFGYAGAAGSATADIMHFTYTQLSGNGQIIARFASATNTGFGGIMIRESLAPGSKKVNVRTQGNLNIEREVRFATDASEVTQQWPRYHKWLRLDRTGNVFNMYSSPNGVAWWFLGTVNVAMNQCVLIGVFAEGINQTTSTTAVMDNIMINTGTPVIPPPFGNLVQFDDQEVLDETGIGLTPDFRIYPNPSSNDEEVTMELVGILEQKVRVSIYSLQGVLLKTTWVDGAEATTTMLDVRDFPDGVYLVNMLTEDKQSVSKMLRVVQR